MTRFDALELSLEIIAALQPLIAKIKRHDRKLAKQLSESSDSIPGNLAEGRGRLGGDRQYHFSVADGTTRESIAHLRVAIAKRILGAAECAAVLALLDREAAMTWRLCHPR